MKRILLAIAFIASAQVSFAQDEAFKKDVMKYIEVSGSNSQIQAAKKQLLAMIPAEKHAAFIIEFDATMPAYYEKIAKVYSEVYTKEDMKAMLALYETPIGKKMAAKQAEVFEKSQTAMQDWGMGLQGMMMKYMQ
jgi:uncharacterized protein